MTKDEAFEEAESRPQSCSICGKIDLLLYPYRDKIYCHECLRPIMEVVNEQDNKHGPLKPDDHIFWPKADEETRNIAMDWTMADLLRRGEIAEEIVYAWHKCGFFPPSFRNQFREFQGQPAIESRLTSEELAQWDEAIKEYRRFELRKLPTLSESEQWVIVNKLENGETSVVSKRGVIDVFTYEKAKELLSLKIKPGVTGYTPDGGLYGSTDLLGDNIIRVIDREAIPRTDYNPKKHDTFHIRLGPALLQKAHKASNEAILGKGLLVDLKQPGTAFDVMGNLLRVCQAASDYQLEKLIREAHPVVWAPHMVATAIEAVSQLHEAVTADADTIFLNPMLWLYTVPCYEGCPAEKAVDPITTDGHIPFPNDWCPDLGAPIVAQLFALAETEIRVKYFYLLRKEPMNLDIRYSNFQLGSQPQEYSSQFTLKMLRFTASPYLIVTRYSVQRSVRKRVENIFAHVSTGVGLILLRRKGIIYQSRSAKEGQTEVDWSCQWWVSGHWRNQPYGSAKKNTLTHKLIWIPPYIKGPPDKPLKEAVRLIVR